MTDPPVLTEHTLELRRILDASPALVWAACTTPAQVERWFAPRPVVIRPGSVVIDLQVGGAFTLVMVMPDGTEFPDIGTFSEVDEPRILAWTATVEGHPGLAAVATIVRLHDLGDGRTELAVTQILTCSDEMPDLARRGWTQALVQLAEVLAGAG